MLQGRHLSAVFVFCCLMGLSFAAHSVPSPDLIATKTNTAPAGQVAQGGSFEWHVELSNIGDADAQFSKGNAVFTDPLPSDPDYGTPTSSSTSVDCSLGTVLGSLLVTCTANKDFVLDPQSPINIVIPVHVAADTPTQDLVNTSGTYLKCKVDPQGVVDESDETNNECAPNTVTIVPGVISLAKTVMPAGGSCGTDDHDSLDISAPGDVTYCYKVTNLDTTSIEGLEVTDDKIGPVSGCSATLAGGASTTCSKDKTVTQAEITAGTEIVNRGSASATGVVPVTDTATLTFHAPAITLDKKVMLRTAQSSCGTDAVDSLEISAPHEVMYCYTVTNTGNVDINDLAVTDDLLGEITNDCFPTLAVAASTICTAAKSVSQAEIDAGTDIVNTGTASATGAVDATDTATLKFTHRAISLVKTAQPTTYQAVGEKIGYSYVVTNTGNVTLTPGAASVADDKVTTVTCPAAIPVAPGDTVKCTAEYSITQEDLDTGSVVNKATATVDGVTSTEASATVTAVVSKAISLVKTAQPTTYQAVDDKIAYRYDVTNTGNVTLDPGAASVADDKVTVTCPVATPVAPGGTVECTAEYRITKADLKAGSVTNTARATIDTVESTETSATVTFVVKAISLAKTVMPANGSCGTQDLDQLNISVPGNVTYCYKVTNTGDVSIDGLRVTDDLLTGPVTGCSDTLAVGASTTCSKDKTVTQDEIDTGTDIVNTGTASARDVTDDATDTATLRFVGPGPDLIVTKTNNTPANEVPQGNSFDWHVELSNIGDAGAQFSKGNGVFSDPLPNVPDTTATYGTPTSSNTSVVCLITHLGSSGVLLNCEANENFVIDPQSTIDIVIPVFVAVHAPLDEPLVNPSPGSFFPCGVDIGGVIDESDESNNGCIPNTVTIIQGVISIAKTVMPANGSCGTDDHDSLDIKVPGEVTYCYKVTNLDTVNSIDVLTVNDDLLGGIDGCSGTLAAGASTTCTINKPVTQAEIDARTDIVNRGAVSATGVDSVTDTATLTFHAPAMTLEKKVYARIVGSESCEADGVDSLDISKPVTVIYCYKVTNTGNVRIDGLKVTDDLLGPITLSCSTSLKVGGATTCTITKLVSSEEVVAANDIINTGTASATTPGAADATDTATLTFRTLGLVKTAQPTTYKAVGEKIDYSYVVTNDGNVSLDPGAASVTDDKVTTVTCPAATPVAPGGTVTCTAEYSITQADLDAGSVVNKATATVDGVPSTEASATVTAVVSKAISLVKTAQPTTYQAVGEKIAYRYVVTNDGNVSLDPGAASVTDDKVTVTCPAATPVAPGGTVTCTAEYSITPADLKAGSVTNTAKATIDTVESAETSVTVTAGVSKAISLAKTVMATGGSCETNAQDSLDISAPGDVTYCYKVTNTGKVRIAGLAVTDDLLTGPVTGCSDTLAVGASTTCSKDKTVTQDEIDAGTDIVNTGTATTTTTGVADAIDTATLQFTRNPAISLVKTVMAATGNCGTDDQDSLDISAPGEVTYCYKVTNTGNVSIAGLAVTDDLLTGPATGCSATLAVAASTICSKAKTVTQDEVDAGTDIVNTGTASATDVTNATDTATLKFVRQGPDLIATKTNTAPSWGIPQGSPFEWHVELSNIGNADAQFSSGDSVFTDPLPNVPDTTATYGEPTSSSTSVDCSVDIDQGFLVTCKANKDFVLDPQSPIEIVIPVYVAVDALQEDLVNPPPGASLECKVDPNGSIDETDESNNECIPNSVTIVQGMIRLSKTVMPAGGSCDTDAHDSLNIKDPGDVTYCYKVTNTMSLSIHGLTVNDDLLGSITGCSDTLAGGASTTCTINKTVPQAEVDAGTDIVNRGTATTTDNFVPPVTDTATLTFHDPAMTLEKTVMLKDASCGTDDQDSLDISAPGDVTYCYKVTNTGDVSIDGLTVNDDLLHSITGCSATLAVGASTTCTINKVVTQAEIDTGTDIVNKGTASSTTPGGAADATDTATLTFTRKPAISLLKTALPTTYKAVGEKIGYSYVVTNTGNVALTPGAASVADDKVTVTCPAATPVAPGGTVKCTAEYSITQADLDAGSVVNKATATVDGVTSTEVSATVDAEVNKTISLLKTALPTTYKAVGEKIGYSYVVTNTGNVALTPGAASVADDKVTVTCPAATPVAPGGTVKCTAEYSITQADLDAGSVVNKATATVDGVTSTEVSATVTAAVDKTISLLKTAQPTTYQAVGEKIGYSYVVTNTGNVTLTPGAASVADDKVTTVTCPAAIPVAPGDTVKCTAEYSITQEDLDTGSVVNKATATVDGVTSTEVSATVDAVSIKIVKSASPESYALFNESITYRFEVENTGNLGLTDVTITDPLSGLSAIDCGDGSNTIASLLPTEVADCEATYLITQADMDAGNVTNAASVSAENPDPLGEPVTADSNKVIILESRVECLNGALIIPDGQIFRQDTTLSSETSISTETPPTLGVIVEAPNTLTLLAPEVEFNPLFRTEGDADPQNPPGGGQLKVTIGTVTCP